jgi:DNA invertase Pin-like site-specific DNA recombinase
VAGCTSVASFASIAEFEIKIRKERQMEGIAKEKGVQFGRKPKLQERRSRSIATGA